VIEAASFTKGGSDCINKNDVIHGDEVTRQ